MAQAAKALEVCEETEEAKLGSSDQAHAMKRVFDLINMWSRVTDIALLSRTRDFIMKATPEEFLKIHQSSLDLVGEYIFEDPTIQPMLDVFEGRQVGFCIKKCYESTLAVEYLRFRLEPGIERGIPVMWCASRKDYVDAMLGNRDPLRMVLARKLGTTRTTTLLKWWLPHLDVLVSDDFAEKCLSLQPRIEEEMGNVLASMGY